MRWLLLSLMLVGCTASAGQPLSSRYAGAPSNEPTSTLVIQFTGQVAGAHVSVNGAPVVSDARTSQITVEGIPPGEVAVMLAAEGGVEKAFGLHLEPGEEIVVPISTPSVGPKPPHPAIQAALTLFVYLAYSGISSLF
jgi:hypothetical protein